MELEVVVSPDDEGVQAELGDAPGWPKYAAELRDVLRAAIAASGVDSLRIDALNLRTPLPLPRELAWLRNGVSIAPDQAVDLFLDMMAHDTGPSFRLLGADVLRIEESWDGWVFLPTTREIYDALEGALDGLPEEHLTVELRRAQRDILNIDIPVEAVADEEFWAQVRHAARTRTTLLGEQWAFGSCGTRWFLLTPENVEGVIAAMEPGSLVSVAVDPDLRVRLLDKGFTAFSAPLLPGELTYRYFSGIDDAAELAEVTGSGFALFLSDAALAELYAVVPDADGIARRQWDDPKQFL